MSSTLEQYQWLQGKGNILRDYSGEIRKVGGETASRNFYAAPGFITEAGILAERDAKFKLAELNMKIAESAIQRELKTVEHNYKILSENAKTAWSIQKQTLLNEMQVYITELKRLQELDEESINRITVEIEAQRTIILEAETAIKLQVEVYNRQELAEKESALGYDKLLVQAEMETAKERLNLIPVLEQLVTEEERVLNRTAEELVPVKLQYLAALTELVERKQDLIPLQLAIQEREYTLVGTEIGLSETEAELAAKQIDIENAGGKLVDRQAEIATQERNLITRQQRNISYTESLSSLEEENTEKEKTLAVTEKELALKESGIYSIENENSGKQIEISEKSMLNSEKQKVVALLETVQAETERALISGELDLINSESVAITEESIVTEKEITQLESEKSIAAAKSQVSLIEKTVAENEQLIAGEERNTLFPKESELAYRQRSLADRQIEEALAEKQLALKQADTVSADSSLAEKEKELRVGMLEAVRTMLDTDKIRLRLEELNQVFNKNELTYLQIRKLIAEKRKALRDIEIEWILDGMEQDILLSEYRAATQLNASMARSKMDVGNESSAGVSVDGPGGGGQFISDSENMDGIRTDMANKDLEHSLTIGQEKTEARRDSVKADVAIQNDDPKSGFWYNNGEGFSFGVNGTIRAAAAINGVADLVASHISASSNIKTRLQHVLGRAS